MSEVNKDHVICPNCAHQFFAISKSDQDHITKLQDIVISQDVDFAVLEDENKRLVEACEEAKSSYINEHGKLDEFDIIYPKITKVLANKKTDTTNNKETE